MASYTVVLEGGSPWGFRLKGGRGTGVPLVVSKINPGSKAAVAHINVGDVLERINGQPTHGLDHQDALNLVRNAATHLELVLSKPPSLNGPVINNNNNNMSTETTVSGQQSVSNFAVDDETVSVDGVTFHGFSPSNVSVTRTTTTKVIKTTRSRSPSPSRGRSSSSENLTIYPTKTTVHYDSEPENEVPPVKFMSGVMWTPPGSKGMLHPHSIVIPARSNVGLTDRDICTCDRAHPSHPPSHTTSGGHATKECSQITSRPPRPREPATQPRLSGKPMRHRSSFFIRPRSRSSDASRKAPTAWKPVTFKPRSKDDTAKYAFSSPPVPPPPPESDTEDVPPVIPPKPKVVKRKLYLSANQPRVPPEIQLKPVTNGRVRKTSRGAEMFFKRQAEQGILKDPGSPEEPPPPRMLATNNNMYPTSPTSPKQKPIPPSSPPNTQSYPYAQSPPKQDSYHQPVRPQRADSDTAYTYDASGDRWPVPPPPIASPSQPSHADENPGTQTAAGSSPKPAAWSPQQSNPTSYQPVENKTPSAWTPVSVTQPKGFKPVRFDLNAKPKPWNPQGASEPNRDKEPPPASSSQYPTWQPPPPSSQPSQHTGPVTNGDLYRPVDKQQANEVQSSPYRPGDPYHDQERYNPGYQQHRPGEPHQCVPEADSWQSDQLRSPQDARRPEFRPVPEGYSSGLPRSVSPTVTLLQYQRERDKEQRSKADYLPPDNSLMPPSLVARAPSGVAKGPVAVTGKTLHAGTNVSVLTDHDDLPEGAVFQKQTVEGDVIHTDTYYPVKTREVTKKTTHKEAPRYEGIGPKDETGLPIGLRAHVKEENRHDWYKEMFKTIHKQDRPEDEIDQTYMDALLQEANTYAPSYSFPDGVNMKNNDDNVFEDEAPSVVKRYPVRSDQWSHDPTLTVSPPSSPKHSQLSPNTSARNTIDRYHQQPRSIIDYEPGKSSLAERDKSPTAQLYNPPVEPISAVQNTKRSTTLPRDFAQFNQVPVESPSARHVAPQQGTNPSIFSTNPYPCKPSAFISSHDSLNGACRLDCPSHQYDESMTPRRSITHFEFWPSQDVVLDSGILTGPRSMIADATVLDSKTETAETPCSSETYNFSIQHIQEENITSTKIVADSHASPEIASCIIDQLSKLPLKPILMKSERAKCSHKPHPGIFRKPRLDLGGAPTPTPVRPHGAAHSEPVSGGNGENPHEPSIEEQVDDSEGNGELPLRFGPRGTADGCSGADHTGIACQISPDGKVMCHDCDTGETVQPRYLPRPTSLFEPYSLERERERSSSQPSSASPRSSGISLNLLPQPSAAVKPNNVLPQKSDRSPTSADTKSDKSGPPLEEDDDWEVQKPGSLSPDQLTADGEQTHKRGRVGPKHQKLKHIKKHRSERYSPKDEDPDMVPYSERPNAKNFAPMGKRRAISAENLSLAVKSPAFNQESYQKYATGLKKASQQSKTYEDLVRFYSEVNRHLEREDKERMETMREKYMPKPAQLETFYRTLQYFSELEMAAQCGENTSDKRKSNTFGWDIDNDAGLKKKEKDIFELYDFYEKLERGAIGTPTTEERLEQIRMQTYLQKAKELEARQLRVGQLYEWYENIDTKASTTPSLANSQVASLQDFDSTEGQSERVIPSSQSNSYAAAESTESRIHKRDLSLADLESLIPRVPLVDPPLESYPSRHRPLGKASTLPRLYTTNQNRGWSSVTMPSVDLSKRDKQNPDDRADDIIGEEEVKATKSLGHAQPPATSLDVEDHVPGRKTPPFMVTGRPSPVIRRKSFDKAISGEEDQGVSPDELKETDESDGLENNLLDRRNRLQISSGLGSLHDNFVASQSHQDIQVSPPPSPRQEVVRPGSPEASAPPKLPERSMSTGVLGIQRVIGTMYNPGLGRLQRWNRTDLSQIEDEDLVPDEEVLSPAESRSRAPPIGRVGKMQSDSSLPTVARGSGKSLAKNGMKKFAQSQSELGWRNFNASPKPFKPLSQTKGPKDDTDQESSLASFDLEPLDSLPGDDGIDVTLDPFSRGQPHDKLIAEATEQQSQFALGQQVKAQSLHDSSSELDHKSKIQLFEEKIVEQRGANQQFHPPQPQKNTSKEQSKTSPAVHVRKASGDQDDEMSSKGHSGLVIGIFSKPQQKEEEVTIWPPTPSPQQELCTPPGASYLTQSLPHNFQFSGSAGKPGMPPSHVLNQLRSTSASADCAGVNWGKRSPEIQPKKLDQPGQVITRYAFSTDEVYEERTPISSRNVSPLPPDFSRHDPLDGRLLMADGNRPRVTHSDAQPRKPPPVFETTHYQSYPQTKANVENTDGNLSNSEIIQHHQDAEEVHVLSLDLQDLDTTGADQPASPSDTYTPSCSYSPSPTPSQDYLEDVSSQSRHPTQGVSSNSRQHVPSSHWLEPESESVFYWDTYIPSKYAGENPSLKHNEQETFKAWDLPAKENSNPGNLTPTNDWSESYSTLQALSPEPPKYKTPPRQYTQLQPNRTNNSTSKLPEYSKQKSVENSRQSTDPQYSRPTQSKKHSEPPPKYPRGHPADKWHDPVAQSGYQSPRPAPLYQGEALVPQKSSSLPQQRKSPRKKEEPIRSTSRPLSSTLPRAKNKSRSLESSGLSAAERLGIKTAPPQRTPSTGSKPSRHSSGSDKIYNYRDPPPTLDRSKAERVIEEERRKRERLQAEEQKQRRHSDYTPIKSPIITNDRFRDPVISSKEDARKQEVKACAIALYPFKAQTHKELSFNKGDIIYLLRKIDKNWYEGEHHGHAGIFPSSYVEVVTSLEDAKKAQLHGPGMEGKARAKYKFTGETRMELNFNKGEYIALIKKIDANWWEGYIGDRKGIFPAAYVEVLREPTGVTSPPAVKSPPPSSHTPYQPSTQQMVQSSPMQQQRSQPPPSSTAGRSSLGSSGSQGSYASSHREPERYFDEPIPKPSKTLAAGQDLYVASYAYTPQNEDEIELQEGDLVNVLEKCDDGWFVGMSKRTGMFGTFPGNYVYKHET